MTNYSSLADDFYVNMNLNTEMALPAARETILGFFERVQKTYPTMRNFYTRESGDFVLEEDKEQGHYRWISIEGRRVCSGHVNPASIDAAMEQHRLVLELIPYMLSVSPLDCEALDCMMGFDFSYRGNHDALVAEALGTCTAFEGLMEIPDSQVINLEPSITIDFDQMRSDMEFEPGQFILETLESLSEGERKDRCREILRGHEYRGAMAATLMPGALELVDELARLGIPQAILTRNSRDMTDLAL